MRTDQGQRNGWPGVRPGGRPAKTAATKRARRNPRRALFAFLEKDQRLRLVILVVVAAEEAAGISAVAAFHVQHLRVLLPVHGHRHEVVTRAHRGRATAAEATEAAAARCAEELCDVAKLVLVHALRLAGTFTALGLL